MTSVLNKINVPFLDLKISNGKDRERYLRCIEKILIHGLILNGPEIGIFEEQIATYCECKYAIGVGSGTDALILALKAIGIGPGDEIIVPCLSFVGTANAISMLGATPIFVDVNQNLLINSARVKEAITNRTKAIMPVHFTGKVSPMKELVLISEEFGIPIIEDAAPAFGATYFGHKAGSIGLIGCISMNPMKILNGIGEAGVILTNDESIKDKLYELRYHGIKADKETCINISLNARIDTIQAALLCERLLDIESIISRRREIAKKYTESLSHLITTPEEQEGCRDVYYTYTILSEERDGLSIFLSERGIETRFYHRRLMPDQPVYSNINIDFPIGKNIAKTILCLPLHEKLTNTQIEYVIDSIHTFYEKNKK